MFSFDFSWNTVRYMSARFSLPERYNHINLKDKNYHKYERASFKLTTHKYIMTISQTAYVHDKTIAIFFSFKDFSS